MPLHRPPRIPSFVPLAMAAVVTAAAVAACDRPDTRASAPERFAENGAGSPMDAQRPAPATPDGRPLSPTPPAGTPSDTAITGNIKSAILNDPGMAGADVSVNTSRGVVVLTGVAKSPEQVALASAHAQRQDGVMRVDTDLNVSR